MRRSASGPALVLAGALLAPRAAAQGAVTSSKLGEDVLMLTGRGSNMAVLRTSGGLVVVDTLMSPLHAREARAVIAREFPGLPVRYVFNTHYHPDHNFGNQEYPEALVVSHERTHARLDSTLVWAGEMLRAPAELERLRGELGAESRKPPEQARALAAELGLWETRLARFSGFVLRKADLRLRDGIQLALGGKTVEVRHPGPAHTDGDLVVRFVEDRVLVTGDLVFHRSGPVIDAEGGADVEGWIGALEGLARDPGAVAHVVPGHGKAATLEALDEQRSYLVDLWSAVRRARSDGLTLDEAKARIRLDRYADYERPLDDLATNVEGCWKLLDRTTAVRGN